MLSAGEGGFGTEQINCPVHGNWRALEFEAPAHVLAVVLSEDDDLQAVEVVGTSEGRLKRIDKRPYDLSKVVGPHTFHGQPLSLEFYDPFHSGNITCSRAVSQHG